MAEFPEDDPFKEPDDDRDGDDDENKSFNIRKKKLHLEVLNIKKWRSLLGPILLLQKKPDYIELIEKTSTSKSRGGASNDDILS